MAVGACRGAETEGQGMGVGCGQVRSTPAASKVSMKLFIASGHSARGPEGLAAGTERFLKGLCFSFSEQSCCVPELGRRRPPKVIQEGGISKHH